MYVEHDSSSCARFSREKRAKPGVGLLNGPRKASLDLEPPVQGLPEGSQRSLGERTGLPEGQTYRPTPVDGPPWDRLDRLVMKSSSRTSAQAADGGRTEALRRPRIISAVTAQHHPAGTRRSLA